MHNLLLFAEHFETARHVPLFPFSAKIKAQDLVLASPDILHVISPKSANFVHMLERQLSIEICKFLVELVNNLVVFIIRVFRFGCLVQKLSFLQQFGGFNLTGPGFKQVLIWQVMCPIHRPVLSYFLKRFLILAGQSI